MSYYFNCYQLNVIVQVLLAILDEMNQFNSYVGLSTLTTICYYQNTVMWQTVIEWIVVLADV